MEGMYVTEAQKKAARARFKRDGGFGKKKRGSKALATRRSGGGGGGGGGSSRRMNKRKSLVYWLTVGGGILMIASALGRAEADRIQSQVMEFAAAIGISTGAGLLAAAVALKLAASTRMRDVPVVGAVGQEYRNYLADFNMKP